AFQLGRRPAGSFVHAAAWPARGAGGQAGRGGGPGLVVGARPPAGTRLPSPRSWGGVGGEVLASPGPLVRVRSARSGAPRHLPRRGEVSSWSSPLPGLGPASSYLRFGL